MNLAPKSKWTLSMMSIWSSLLKLQDHPTSPCTTALQIWEAPSNKYVGLLGFGSDATAVHFQGSLHRSLHQQNLSNIYCYQKSVEESQHFNRHRSSNLPIQPEMWHLSISPTFHLQPLHQTNQQGLSSAQLLVDLNNIISSFDTDHDNGNIFEAACEKCKPLRAY